MSVLPTSTSPIIIPDADAYQLGEYTGAIGSPAQKSIYETFLNEGRSAIFRNPVGDAITGFGSNLTGLYDAVNNSNCLSAGDKTDIITVLGTPGGSTGLIEQLELFSIHTQILSGVIPQGTNATPGLDRILSVGRTLGGLAYSIDSASNCFSLLNNMTGLFSNDLLNGYGSEIAGMISSINSCLATAADIISRINEMVTTLQNIINADNNFFNNALEQLRQAALASLLESIYSNPCGKFLLESKIGQSKLMGYLR